MSKMVFSFVCFLLFVGGNSINAQDCINGELPVVLEIETDQYGYEFSWLLLTIEGDTIGSSENSDYDNNTYYEEKLCIDPDLCHVLFLRDTYGDGFREPGFVRLIVDGDVRFTVDNFGNEKEYAFNCAAGFTCDNPKDLELGSYTLVDSTEWFRVVPDTTGTFALSTCENTIDCTSVIYAYEDCPDVLSNSVEGTIFYNDGGDVCGDRAYVEAYLIKGHSYLVRVQKDLNCATMEFDFSFIGPVIGCTDASACNYNPLATIDDGTCIPFGAPECGLGPDLVLDIGTLRSSIRVETKYIDDQCQIEENCVKGVGYRDLMRFTTTIHNTGPLDYYIGLATEYPEQYEFENCHNHIHYDNYAEYSLYDRAGQYIPIGYKSGFCVLDLICPDTITAQFNCNLMGITSGCSDEYDANLECQWLDITDILDGDYVFVAVVNADNAADALGRYEMDHINNHAQVCINISRATGEIVITQLDDCDPYIDCKGDLYGKAVPDCKGVCEGPTVRGDMNSDQTINMSDINAYVDAIMDGVPTTDCNDLFQDGVLDVYDAALLHGCYVYSETHAHEGGTSAHDHCFFPAGINNFLKEVSLKMTYDKENDPEYVTIDIKNSDSNIKAFQFELIGADIEAVYQNTLIGEQLFDFHINKEKGLVVAMPIGESAIGRAEFHQGLMRVKITNVKDKICISENSVFIDDTDQKNAFSAVDICVETGFAPDSEMNVLNSLDHVENDPSLEVFPIPSSTTLNINILDESFKVQKISVVAVGGIEVYENYTGALTHQINVESWSEGMYFVIVSSEQKQMIKKIIVH